MFYFLFCCNLMVVLYAKFYKFFFGNVSMVDKLLKGLRAHNLDDGIVLNSIAAVNEVFEYLPGHVSHGIAVQSYLPKESFRKTVDLDIDIFFGGGTSSYKEIFQPMKEVLVSQGYEINTKKKGSTFDHFISKDGDSYIIQFPRRSQSNFEKKRKKSLEREISNQQIIFRNGITYPVISPEDLVNHKLSRVSNFVDSFDAKVPDYLSREDFKNEADDMRAVVTYSILDTNEKLKEKVRKEIMFQFRVLCDCYDVKALSEFVGLDKLYLDEAISSWENPEKQRKVYSLMDKLKIDAN